MNPRDAYQQKHVHPADRRCGHRGKDWRRGAVQNAGLTFWIHVTLEIISPFVSETRNCAAPPPCIHHALQMLILANIESARTEFFRV